MLYCMNCGHEIPKGAKFCSNCGTAIGEVKEDELYRNTKFDGELHKCPSCGEILNSFVKKCPSCDYELRGNVVSSSVKEFAEKLSMAETDNMKASLIRNFPIPNTKEDIFEFMIMASTNFDSNSSCMYINKEIADAWRTKIEQCYQKGKLLFEEDKEIIELQEIYEQTCNKINVLIKREKISFISKILLRNVVFFAGILVFIIAMFLDVGDSVNTAMYHFSGMVILIIGAVMVGRTNNETIDIVIDIIASIIVILLGSIHEELHKKGAIMELAGVVAIIVTIVRLVKSNAGKK